MFHNGFTIQAKTEHFVVFLIMLGKFKVFGTLEMYYIYVFISLV